MATCSRADFSAFYAEQLRRAVDDDMLSALRGYYPSSRPGAGARNSTFNIHTMSEEPPRPQPKPRAPSKFDGPNVIDLVLGADGVWMVPAALEPRVRAL
jgi:hypothetical protein